MRGKTRIIAVVAAGTLAALALGGCTLTHSSDNASVVQPTGPASVIQFPYGFRNIAYKCDGTTMVYSLSAGTADDQPGGVAVVPNDPRCK